MTSVDETYWGFLSPAIARAFRVFPIGRDDDGTLVVAAEDEFNCDVEALERLVGEPVRVQGFSGGNVPAAIGELIDAYYDTPRPALIDATESAEVLHSLLVTPKPEWRPIDLDVRFERVDVVGDAHCAVEALRARRVDHVIIDPRIDGGIEAAWKCIVAEFPDVTIEIASIPEEEVASLSSLSAPYNRALNAVGGGLWSYDVRKRSLWLSPGLADLAGTPCSPIQGITSLFNYLVYPDDRETVERAMRAAAKARQSRIETRHRLRTAQGKAIWVHSWGECQRERGRSGRILTFSGGTLALGVEELTLFHALDEITSCFVFVKDRELRFRLVNQAVADAFGRTKEEIIGKTDAELSSEKAEVRFFNEADVKVLGERIIGGVHSGGRLAIDEEVFTDVNGNKRYLATIKRPITVPSGEIWLLGIATDISDVRKLRREVLHLTARVHLQSKGFERILEGIKHYVWVGDTTGRYVTCNRAFAKLFGLKDAKEVFGKSDAALWSDDDAVRLQDECKRLLSSPQDDKDRCEHRTLKSGCRVRLIERRIVLCGPSNEPVGILGIGKAGANELSEPDRVQQLSSAIDRSASELVSAISTHKELSGVVVAHPRPK